MVDIHILRSLVNNPWWNQCINSFVGLETVIKPIVVDNFGRDLIMGRNIGYNLGENEYVSFVDDDDYLCADSDYIEKIVDDGNPASFTNSVVLSDSGKIHNWIDSIHTKWTIKTRSIVRCHQLMIMKRGLAINTCSETTALIKLKGWHPMVFDYVFITLMAINHGWTYYNRPQYVWRFNGARNRRFGSIDSQAAKAYFNKLIEW